MSEIKVSEALKAGEGKGARSFAFVTGCSRSGTTALARLLNRHPDICIGFERYSKVHRRRELSPAHFEAGRFMDVREDDTHYADLTGFRAFHALKIGEARVVGDKIPRLSDHYKALFRAFPDARVVYILRDPVSVAESYARRANDHNDPWAADRGYLAAIDEWNESMKRTEGALAKRPGQIGVFCFHDLLITGQSLPRLYRFLDVPAPDEDHLDEEVTLTPAAQVDPALRKAVAQTANFAAYRRLLKYAAAQEESIA